MIVEVGLLWEKADLRFHLRIGPFMAQDACRSGAGEHESHQQFQRGGLAGAVRSEKTEDLSVFYREVERMQSAFRQFSPETYAISLSQP